MLTVFGATALGLASPDVGSRSLAEYALVTSAVVLNAATAIRITAP